MSEQPDHARNVANSRYVRDLLGAMANIVGAERNAAGTFKANLRKEGNDLTFTVRGEIGSIQAVFTVDYDAVGRNLAELEE